MPRQVRDSNLETRTARSRLKARHKPYFRLIEPGVHLGYRKLSSGPGTWIARRYIGQGAYTVENLRTPDGALVLADDYDDADGKRVLNFAQAQRAARGPRAACSTGGYTVADAMDDYFRFLAGDGRSKHSIYDAQRRDEIHIRPALGKLKVSALSAERLRRWRDELAKAAARLRTRKGATQKYREPVETDDARRARRASANRTWTVLRAALNHAYHEGEAESDAAWRKVKPYKGVEAARIRYLTIAEATRLINSCDLEFRPMVEAALQTGCRYGELCRLTVADFNSDSGTLANRHSKSGKPRHVVLTNEGIALFARLTAGRAGHELILRKPSGEPFGMSHQARPMAEAVARARITPHIGFHGLRHTWASLAVMAGMPLMVVARNLGHADTRMVEKHYGHLAPSYVADAVRAAAPRFGTMPGNVRSIRGRREGERC
jgi:integrase